MKFITNIKLRYIVPVLFWLLLSFYTQAQSSQALLTDSCIKYFNTRVLNASGPSEIRIADTAIFEVAFGLTNTCGRFNKFSETHKGNSYTITVNAVYKGCACDDMPFLEKKKFYFKPLKTGVYYLKFNANEVDELVREVKVR